MNNIQVRRGKRVILALDTLDIAPHQFTVILGHNGSGKSTLLNLIARQFKPDHGYLELGGKRLDEYSQRDFARRIAFLPQRLPEVVGLTVRELVRLGRFPWRGLFGRWQTEDNAVVERALLQTDIAQYAGHLADSLSGGERQRAWISMLLAQESPLILLDEPTSALDLAHQYALMTLLRGLNQASGRGIIAVLHDVNLTTRYADRIIVLKEGQVHFDGSPEQLLSSDRLSELYDIDIELIDHPGNARQVAVVR
jgi:iron complex transport system ATP-binding protein